MNTTTVATAVQRRWACHTLTVFPADAYGRQRCNVVLSACSIVYLWYMFWAVCSWERAIKTDKILPVRTYKIGLIQRNPGNRLTHSRRKKKKKMTPSHASYSARIELKRRPQVPDGLPVSMYLAFWLNVLVRTDMIQNRRKKSQICVYIWFMWYHCPATLYGVSNITIPLNEIMLRIAGYI